MDKLEFPADMPVHIRQLLGAPTADIIRAWEITQPASVAIKATLEEMSTQDGHLTHTTHQRLADGARGAVTSAKKGGAR